MEDLIFLPTKNVKVIADFNVRSLAFLIDVIIFFFLILMPFSSIYYEIAGIDVENLTIDEAMNNPEILGILGIGYFSCLIIFAFYLSAFEYLFGGSVGKKMMNLTVVGKNKKLTLFQAVIRNLSKSVLINLLPFDCFLMIFDPQKRRVSDYLANTLVISNKKVVKKFSLVNEV